MTAYRCVFLDRDGKIAASRDFEAPNDRHALIIARALYAERATRYGFELQQEQRRVHREN